MANKKSIAFFEAGSWYHRVKLLQEDGTTKYSKRGGFPTEKEAEASCRRCEEEYKQAYRAYHAVQSSDMRLDDYLVYWLEQVYSARIEGTTLRVANYVLYDLLLPNMDQGIKLRYINAEYLDELLAAVSRTCESAGNKSRELLNIALKDAAAQGYIHSNPVPDTKPYKRRKPKIIVLSKEKMKFFLEKAADSNWYMEILLGLFLGLRKGEILGLKYGDFDVENRTVKIARQITSSPKNINGQEVTGYLPLEKPPKTPNSNRTLRVPEAVMDQVIARKKLIDFRKEQMGGNYMDHDYISCSENGLPHAAASFNTALTRLCSRNGLPHLTVHSLRHMYATILAEQGVPLMKISTLLGHSSVHTTFEYYCEVMDEQERILEFMNRSFMPEGGRGFC